MQHRIKSLGVALHLLSFFSSKRAQWGVTDLAKVCGLHKSEVSRILATFAAFGFVQKHNRDYRLGRAFKGYAELANSDEELIVNARPVMQELSAETGGTVLLKIREATETVTIDRVESQHFLRLAYPIGLRLPLNASSSGKVFLAHMPELERSAIYRDRGFKRFTNKTKTNLSALEKEITTVRRTGYAVSDEEHILGARGLAAPIFGSDSNLKGTMGVGLPKVLLPDKLVEMAGLKVREAAQKISYRLGYRTENNGGKASIGGLSQKGSKIRAN